MISKRRKGSRIGVVFNGSPLFTGRGSGESRSKWVIENDWLSIVSLPDQLFLTQDHDLPLDPNE